MLPLVRQIFSTHEFTVFVLLRQAQKSVTGSDELIGFDNYYFGSPRSKIEALQETAQIFLLPLKLVLIRKIHHHLLRTRELKSSSIVARLAAVPFFNCNVQGSV